MKKLCLIPILLLFVLILGGCNFLNTKEELPIEMIAYNSLTEEEKDLIPVSPKDSIVEKVVVTNEMESLIRDDYSQTEVYTITFNNTETDRTGKLIIFVSLNQKTVVGKGFADK